MATHYVSSSGSASWANSTNSATPCSMATANANAAAGDTVYLRAGTYSAYINPANSGTSGSRIVFQNYGSTDGVGGEQVTISGAAYAIYLNGRDYITILGIDGANCTNFLWLINGANFNIVGYCNFDQTSSTDWEDCSVINGSSQRNWIHHCQFSKGGYNDPGAPDDLGCVFWVGNESSAADQSWYNLIEDCTFFHGGHHVVAFSCGNNTFRNNYIHNEAWSNGYGNRCLYTNSGSAVNVGNVLEGNRWGYTAESIDDGPVGNVVITSPYNLIRFNAIYHSYAYGMGLAGYSGYSNAVSNRIYNNTFFNNGLGFSSGQNDAHVNVTTDAGQTPSGNVFKNNLYYLGTKYAGQSYTAQTYANEFTTGNPLFVNASTTPPTDKTDATLPNLTLGTGSPAIGYGGALTTVAVADTGTGTTLVLTDASYFQDGTKAPAGRVQADWIAVGTLGNVVQIASISGNTVTLANSITRSDGQSVWLYKKSDGEQVLYGSAPDAGAFPNESSPPTGTITLSVR